MLISFMDDCHLKANGWFGFGGLIIRDENVMKMEAEFVKILNEAGVPVDDDSVDTEVKWSPRGGNWIRENLGVKRFELYNSLLQLIRNHDAELLAAIFKYKGLSSSKGLTISMWNVERARQEAIVHCFERIQIYAQRKEQVALAVCDNEDDPKKTRKRVRETFRLVKDGTQYIPLDNIYTHAWAVESQYHAGIQLADLVIGITTNLLAGNVEYAQQLWPILRGRFIWHTGMKPSIPQKWGLSILPSSEIDMFIKAYNPYGF